MSGLGISFQGRTYERGLWDEVRTGIVIVYISACTDLR